MKNVFIDVTVATDRPHAKAGTTGLVNMSRCQEIYPHEEGGSKLIMNIPDEVIHVAQSPDTLMVALRAVNLDGERT